MTVEVSVLKNADKIAEAIDNLTDKISGGGGYDAVIKLDAPSLEDVTTATFEEGTYADLAAKALSGKPLTVFVYGVGYINGHLNVCTYDTTEIYVEEYDEEGYITILVDSGDRNVGGKIDVNHNGLQYEYRG